jgi:hypothetical protein
MNAFRDSLSSRGARWQVRHPADSEEPDDRISSTADARLGEDGVHGLFGAGLRAEQRTTPRAYLAVTVVGGAPSSCSGDA